MSKLEIVTTVSNYNHALTRKLWDSIMQLTDAQFVEEIGYSHGSIRNQIIHMATVDGRWLRGVRGERDARQFNLMPAAYATRERARALWEQSAGEVLDYLESLDEQELERHPLGMPGPVWQVLIHLANHGTDHRAQILRALHEFGVQTLDQDFIMHVWS